MTLLIGAIGSRGGDKNESASGVGLLRNKSFPTVIESKGSNGILPKSGIICCRGVGGNRFKPIKIGVFGFSCTKSFLDGNLGFSTSFSTIGASVVSLFKPITILCGKGERVVRGSTIGGDVTGGGLVVIFSFGGAIVVVGALVVTFGVVFVVVLVVVGGFRVVVCTSTFLAIGGVLNGSIGFRSKSLSYFCMH